MPHLRQCTHVGCGIYLATCVMSLRCLPWFVVLETGRGKLGDIKDALVMAKQAKEQAIEKKMNYPSVKSIEGLIKELEAGG